MRIQTYTCIPTGSAFASTLTSLRAQLTPSFTAMHFRAGAADLRAMDDDRAVVCIRMHTYTSLPMHVYLHAYPRTCIGTRQR